MVIQKYIEGSDDLFIATAVSLPEVKPFQGAAEKIAALQAIGIEVTGEPYFQDAYAFGNVTDPEDQRIHRSKQLTSIFLGFAALGMFDFAGDARDRLFGTAASESEVQEIRNRLGTMLTGAHKREKSIGRITLSNNLRAASRQLLPTPAAEVEATTDAKPLVLIHAA